MHNILVTEPLLLDDMSGQSRAWNKVEHDNYLALETGARHDVMST